MNPTNTNIYLVSDSSGETAETVLRAAVNQFDDLKVKEHLWTMVRSHLRIDELLSEAQKSGGIILHTMAYNDVRSYLIKRCNELGIMCICPLESIVQILRNASDYTDDNVKLRKIPGKYLKLDEPYYAKSQSLYFTLNHDDGCNMQTSIDADIILLGVSRTSKTPISLYLAHRGYNVANIPIVPHTDENALLKIRDEAKDNGEKPVLVGLIIAPGYLTKLRGARHDKIYKHLSKPLQSDPYIDDDAIYQEMSYSKQLFRKLNIVTVDVTRKAIEEVAAEIVAIIS